MKVLEQMAMLRDEAWAAVRETQEYKSFAIIDAAFKHMKAEFQEPVMTARGDFPKLVRRKPTHGDIAQKVLIDAKRPLTISSLLDACLDAGMNIAGDDPLASFRSTVSRDDRFKSIKQNGVFYWWLKDVPIPEKWEAESSIFHVLRSSATPENEEGGNGHEPVIT